jgi:hypothetical protein
MYKLTVGVKACWRYAHEQVSKFVEQKPENGAYFYKIIEISGDYHCW